jgi:hypothetical protein
MTLWLAADAYRAAQRTSWVGRRQAAESIVIDPVDSGGVVRRQTAPAHAFHV